MQFWTIPTGVHPPKPSEANVGSPLAATLDTKSLISGAAEGIGGGSGIVSKALLPTSSVLMFRTKTAAVIGVTNLFWSFRAFSIGRSFRFPQAM